ncbi:hypothetical protein GINT2_001213 [Glugoides intestinalis]
MNPFNLDAEYDDRLARLITKINKSSALTLQETLKELGRYLPDVNIASDHRIILKTIAPHFDGPEKATVNKIVYFIVKKLGIRGLDKFQIEWLYLNFDNQDHYAKKVIEMYVDIPSLAFDLEKHLKFEDYLRDLQCFKFLVEKSPQDRYFPISKLPLQAYIEFDILFEILELIKTANPLKIIAAKAESVLEDKTSIFLREVVERIKEVDNELFMTRKYKILLNIYDYVDEKIYNESQFIDKTLLRQLGSKNIDFQRLKVTKIDQMEVILPYLTDKNKFLLNNATDSMPIFELISKIGISSQVIVENMAIFTPIANRSILNMHKTPMMVPIDALEKIYPVFTGKYKIIAASLLGKFLEPADFLHEDIDEVLEHSINVFPKTYFFKNKFNRSACFFFKKYPETLNELIKNKKVEEFISNFKGTKTEHIASEITKIETLSEYLLTVQKTDQKRLFSLNERSDLKIVYLFYLRDEIQQFEVDYMQVFEYFFQESFLKFLITKKNNLPGFIKICKKYIDTIPFKNSSLLYGGIFDGDKFFYYNLGLPERDEGLKVLYKVLTTVNLDLDLEFLLHTIEILLYKQVSFSERLKEMLKSDEEVEKVKKTFNLENKGFIIQKLLEKDSEKVKFDTLKVCTKKAMDILLRTLILDKKYLYNLEPSFLSNKALENVMKSVCEQRSEEIILVDLSIIDIDDETLTGQMRKINLHGTNITKDSVPIKNLIKTFLKKSACSNIEDFIYLLENDKVFHLKDFRDERLIIYEPYIDLLSNMLTEKFINMYSITKLERGEDNEVFELILAPLSGFKKSFWLIISRILTKVNNIYISLFIEKMLKLYSIESKEENFLTKNEIQPIADYISVCTTEELTQLAFSFPELYCKLNIKTPLLIEDFVKKTTKRKVDGGKITFSRSGDSYRLRFIYRADSLTHEANIVVEKKYPFKKPKITFESSLKNVKLYHKLTDILSKTSNFAEVFILWKIDIDNHLMGYTECLICYFIMEPKYRTLPEFTCEVCNNCFHEKCIYKWASESKKPHCPFCRSVLPLWENKSKGGK